MPMQKWTCNFGPKHVWCTATRQCNFMGWNLKIQTIEIVWISTSTDGLRFKLTSIPWKSIRDAKSLGRFCFEWAKKLSLKGVSWSLLYYALCLYMYLSWRVCVNISLSMVGWCFWLFWFELSLPTWLALDDLRTSWRETIQHRPGNAIHVRPFIYLVWPFVFVLIHQIVVSMRLLRIFVIFFMLYIFNLEFPLEYKIQGHQYALSNASKQHLIRWHKFHLFYKMLRLEPGCMEYP